MPSPGILVGKKGRLHLKPLCWCFEYLTLAGMCRRRGGVPVIAGPAARACLTVGWAFSGLAVSITATALVHAAKRV